MAMIAIPILALGGLYIMSSENDKNERPSACSNREGFVNMGENVNALPGVNPPQPVLNYPTTAEINADNIKKYMSGQQATDKFYHKDIQNELSNNNPPGSVGSGRDATMSLTGDKINKENFKHNNMQPFFGSKVRGATRSSDVGESILDNMQGQGSQHFSKKEVAPLFKPQSNFQHANGAPNANDFLQSRVNPSSRMANVKPWEEEHVAPGLNKGFNKNPGAGFNSGMESRDCWAPKNVDQLRTKTNPKMSFGLYGHEGPANSFIKDGTTVVQQGRVEKQLPDTYYKVGPERWFTTTGAEKAQPTRGQTIVNHVNRPSTSCSYFGAGGENDSTYVKGEYEAPSRPVLKANHLINLGANGVHDATDGDYGMKSYANLPNNRATTRKESPYGIVQGAMKAITAPIMDILRPSRKENVIGAMRPSGNASSSVSRQPVYNPADRTRTTIREMTENKLDNNHLNMNNQQDGGAGGYLVNDQTPVHVQRDTTGCSYDGNAGPAVCVNNSSYEAAYNQRNNPNKTYENRPNHGGTQMFNQKSNICIAKLDDDRCNNRMWTPSAGTSIIPSAETHGKLNSQAYNDTGSGCDRIQPDILDAFKRNPYAQSLQSWS